MADISTYRGAGIASFFLFELKQQFRSKGTWVCFLIMSLIFYRHVSGSYWDELVGTGRVPVNSPIVIYYIFAFSTYWAAIFATGFMTSPILRDLRYSVAPIIYAMPFKQRNYLIGKYLAGQVTLLFVMSGVFLGFVLLSWIQPSLTADSLHSYMPMPWGHAIHSFILFLFPACFFFGTVHYALAVLTGRISYSYAFSVFVTLVFLSFEVSFQDDTFSKKWPEILDPVGYITLQGQVFYWTAEQRITEYVQVAGTMLQNKLLYIALTLLTIMLLWVKADIRSLLIKLNSPKKGKKTSDETSLDKKTEYASSAPRPLLWNSSFQYGFGVWDMLRLGWKEFKACASEPWFKLVVFTGYVSAFVMSLRLGSFHHRVEGNLYPSAVDVLDHTVEVYAIFGIIAVAFSVGEIMSRERITKVSLLIDSSPVSSWYFICAKLIGCVLIIGLISFAPAIAVISVQVLKGYGDIEWLLHLYTFGFGVFPSLLTFGAVSAAVHIITNERAVGHSVAIISCFSIFMMWEIEVLEHPLLLLGLPVLTPLTVFDSLAQFNLKLFHLNIYYLSVSAVLVLVATWIWPRGVENKLIRRLTQVPRQITYGSTGLLALILGIAGITAFYSYQILNIQNDYKNIQMEKAEDAAYETQYAHIANMPQPKVVNASLYVELQGADRKAAYGGRLTLQNKNETPVDVLHLQLPGFAEMLCLKTGDSCIEPKFVDSELDQYQYELSPPLAAGENIDINIDLVAHYDGYVSKNEFHGKIVKDGSVFDSDMWPSIGYDRSRELHLTGDRLFHKLPARKPLPDVASAEYVSDFSISSQADYFGYDMEVTTDAQQTVVASGHLHKEYMRDGKKVRYYRGLDKSLWDFVIASGIYTGSDFSWESQIDVRIYHKPSHAYNIERFNKATSDSLAFLTKLFGPLPYEEISLVEVSHGVHPEPKTRGNVILIPEVDGWLHDYRKDARRDWILYTVARELSYMWWGQQLVPGDMKGAKLLTDSVPEYLALRIVEHINGINDALDLLALKRDIYLRRRVKEDAIEAPVIEGDDEAYMMEKGVASLYQARNVLGAERLDRALSEYFVNLKYRQQPPYANVGSFLQNLVAQAGDDDEVKQLEELFTETVIHDFTLDKVSIEKASNENFEISLTIDTKKYEVTDSSNHKQTDFASIVVPVLLVAGEQQDMTSIAVSSGKNDIKLLSSFYPEKITVDPYSRFLDSNIRDNTKKLR